MRLQLSFGVSLLHVQSQLHASVVPTRVDVFIAPDSFRRTAGGAVTGQLWLRFSMAGSSAEPREVPGAGWYDFPIPVLSWWLDALATVAEGRTAELLFMDGPYALSLKPGVEGRLQVSGHGVDAEVPAADFEVSLRDAAVRTLATCESYTWSSRDILELRRAAGRAAHYRAG